MMRFHSASPWDRPAPGAVCDWLFESGSVFVRFYRRTEAEIFEMIEPLDLRTQAPTEYVLRCLGWWPAEE